MCLTLCLIVVHLLVKWDLMCQFTAESVYCLWDILLNIDKQDIVSDDEIWSMCWYSNMTAVVFWLFGRVVTYPGSKTWGPCHGSYVQIPFTAGQGPHTFSRTSWKCSLPVTVCRKISQEENTRPVPCATPKISISTTSRGKRSPASCKW